MNSTPNTLSFLFSLVVIVEAIAGLPLAAAIKAMNLEELMRISTGVISGEIMAKDVVRIDWADEKDVTFTRLTIRGEELTTGAAVTREIYYMGGVWEGKVDSPSTAPREYQTRIGARVVAFYWFDPGLTRTGANKIFCLANIYQVQQGAGDPTVIGLGKGAAVPYNVKLSLLRDRVRAIHQMLVKEKEGK